MTISLAPPSAASTFEVLSALIWLTSSERTLSSVSKLAAFPESIVILATELVPTVTEYTSPSAGAPSNVSVSCCDTTNVGTYLKKPPRF